MCKSLIKTILKLLTPFTTYIANTVNGVFLYFRPFINLIKTALKLLTPFIVCIANVVNGILMYLKHVEGKAINENIYVDLSHTCASSIICIGCILAYSTHMCKYYKASCWLIIAMHVMALVYQHTGFEYVPYLYSIWVLGVFCFVCSVISILGYKTANTINQACKRSNK